MKYLVILFLGILSLGIQSLLGQNNTTVINDKIINIQSAILKERRTCFVNLPESYNDIAAAEKRYPLIILLDGKTFLNATTGVVQFMSSNRNRNHLMPESIIVAIENVDRERDFTVTKIKTKRLNTMGGGKRFLSFIEKELIPYMDKNYRTIPHRTLIGHSLGGLLTLQAYMDKNSIFDAYLSIDPSIWWNEEIMKSKVDSIDPVCFKRNLYIATANKEPRRFERNKKRHDHLYQLMKIKSNELLNTKIETFDHENHRSVPLMALYKGLKYVNQNN